MVGARARSMEAAADTDTATAEAAGTEHMDPGAGAWRPRSGVPSGLRVTTPGTSSAMGRCIPATITQAPVIRIPGRPRPIRRLDPNVRDRRRTFPRTQAPVPPLQSSARGVPSRPREVRASPGRHVESAEGGRVPRSSWGVRRTTIVRGARRQLRRLAAPRFLGRRPTSPLTTTEYQHRVVSGNAPLERPFSASPLRLFDASVDVTDARKK
jgi:hypothetical protein